MQIKIHFFFLFILCSASKHKQHCDCIPGSDILAKSVLYVHPVIFEGISGISDEAVFLH